MSNSTTSLGPATQRSNIGNIAQISMFLGQSMYWWTYLGIRSNPNILRLLQRFDQAFFFDDLHSLTEIRQQAGERTSIFFLIFWDGFHSDVRLLEAASQLGPDAELVALVVGDIPEVSASSLARYQAQNLYPSGTLKFNILPTPPFDRRTANILRTARFKGLIMPLKNIWQNRDDLAGSIRLVVGPKKLVFCGVFGTIPAVLKEVCERHLIDFALFHEYKYFCNDPDQSFESSKRYLRSSGSYLADLYDQSKITAAFFLTIAHLLGREYFIGQIRGAGLNPFINGYGVGKNVNVNVYGTPFYSQHVFLDFGSQSVGSGNYPRLANLRFFNKRVLELDMKLLDEGLLPLARAGAIDRHFDAMWDLNSPNILQSLR